MSPLMFRWSLISILALRSAASPDVYLESNYDDSDAEQQPSPPSARPVAAVLEGQPISSQGAGDPQNSWVTDFPGVYSDTVSNRQSYAEPSNVEVVKYVDSPIPDKDMRLNAIKSQMLIFMNRTLPAPTVKTQSNASVLIPSVQQVDVMRALFNNVNTYPNVDSSDAFTEKIQSFYPICEMPKNMNEELWNSKESMNLMFNISVPRTPNGISMNVSAARLRLFKQFVSCYSQSSNETDDTPQTSCQPTFLEDGVKRPANANSSSSAENLSLSMDDRQIRVSVYVRSLKKRKVKRRLLDSRMIPYYGEKWTEWNIHRAVKSWRNPVRNFALSIEVEDEYGNFLPVNRFFKSMNCTGDAQMTTPKPIPGFLMEAVHVRMPVNGVEASNNMSAAEALRLNVYRYPIVDVTMVEWQESEDGAKDVFAQSQADAAQQQAAAQADRETSSGEQHRQHHHRIRHNGGNRHKINATDVQSAVAKLARDIQLQQQQQHQQQVAASHKTGGTVDAATDGSSEIPD